MKVLKMAEDLKNAILSLVKSDVGVIIESGSNSNGNWIKYSDGTMVCYGSRSFTNINMTTKWGVVYESATQNLGSFPQTFSQVPDYVDVHSKGGATVYPETIDATTATSIGRTYFWRPLSSTSQSFTIYYYAIGKWK